MEFKLVTVIDGSSGSLVVEDSYTAKTDSTSGIFNDISLSSTLSPYTLLKVNPLVDVDTPELVLSTIKVEQGLYIFLRVLVLTFLNVTVSIAAFAFVGIP